MAKIAINGLGRIGRAFLKLALTRTSFEDAASSARWNRVLAVTREPLVSTDIVGDPHAAIVDLSLTKVVDGDLCSVYSWYDNEVGYANSLIEHVVEAAKIPVPGASS